MDRGFAILVLNACFRASRELGEAATAVEAFSSEEEGRRLKLQLGASVGEIGRITESIYDTHPDLREYVEQQIDKYGRLS
ncbi:hypothetical protein BH09PSE1_BH09PSE1_26060 [soil metagenome]